MRLAKTAMTRKIVCTIFHPTLSSQETPEHKSHKNKAGNAEQDGHCHPRHIHRPRMPSGARAWIMPWLRVIQVAVAAPMMVAANIAWETVVVKPKVMGASPLARPIQRNSCSRLLALWTLTSIRLPTRPPAPIPTIS